MGHYTGQALAVTFGGVALPGIREVSIPEEHPAPDTTHSPDAHGQGIPGGITYHNGCTMLFVDQSGETSWQALPGGSVGTLAIYPEGIADGKRKITMRIVITNRDRVMSYDNAVVFTVTFNATLYRAGINGEMEALYVATTAGGIFITENFTMPDDPDQPVWTTVNDGLGVLTIHNFDLDPFDSIGRQACLTSTEQTCYIRYGTGNWIPLITRAQAQVLTAVDAVVRWVTFDRTVPGRVWVLAARLNVYNEYIYLLYTDNDGASWNSLATTSTGIWRQIVNVNVSGDIIWLACNGGAGGNGYIYYSDDFGVTWYITSTLGGSSWTPFVVVNPLNSEGYSSTFALSGNEDLVHIATPGMGITKLQDDLNLGYVWDFRDTQTHWFSQNDALYQRILSNDRLYTTHDDWVTVDDPAPAELVAGFDFNSLVTPLASNEDWMILGPRSLATFQEHIIYTLDGDTGIPVGKSGVDPAGGVDSIPVAASGLALNGIGAVVF